MKEIKALQSRTLEVRFKSTDNSFEEFMEGREIKLVNYGSIETVFFRRDWWFVDRENKCISFIEYQNHIKIKDNE